MHKDRNRICGSDSKAYQDNFPEEMIKARAKAAPKVRQIVKNILTEERNKEAKPK